MAIAYFWQHQPRALWPIDPAQGDLGGAGAHRLARRNTLIGNDSTAADNDCESLTTSPLSRIYLMPDHEEKGMR
jgi:hypothetical protein